MRLNVVVRANKKIISVLQCYECCVNMQDNIRLVVIALDG